MARLNEDVNHVSVLINRPPEIVALATDGDEELVQMPGVAEAALSPLEPTGVLAAELAGPLADRLVRNGHPALRQEILDVPEAQTEAMIEPLGPSERAVQTVEPAVFPPLEALWETRWGRPRPRHGGESGSMASNPGSRTGGENQMVNLRFNVPGHI